MTESTTTFTTEDFFNLLARSGLLNEGLFQTLKQRFEGNDHDPKSIIAQMLAEHLLTPFQARQLGERRHRGFFLSDKYKILDFLGQGGMSRVLLCEHMMLQRLVAVKILNKSLDKFPGAAERFLREARAAASMDHPHIARVFDVDRTGLGPCIVMEYVDGTNLHEMAVKRELLAVNRVAHYISQAAIGLQQAHLVGLVHRDIKPANLMLDRTGTVKLLDLGLARFFDPKRSDNLTQQIDASSIIGTADYIAPEQVMESSSADIRADIYSLGYSMYFLLTRVLPAGDGPVMRKLLWHQTRHPEPIRTLRPEVPEGMAAVIERMTMKKPEERYQTPAEVVAALAPWVTEPISPPTDEEMPKTRASAYRLGLCPPPDQSKMASMNSSSSGSNSSGSISTRPPAPSSHSVTDSTRTRLPFTIHGNSASRIGIVNPLDSEAAMPTGSTIRAAKTNDVMSASAETVSTSESSYIRSLHESKSPEGRMLRYLLALLGMIIAFGIGGWTTYWWISAPPWKNYRVTRTPSRNTPAQRPQSNSTTTGPIVTPTSAIVLRGGGSTFIRPAMEQWSRVYEQQTGIKIEYSAVGSSKGVDGMISNFLDFSCTDAPLTADQLASAGSPIVHVPLALGAVAPVCNVTNEAGEPISIRFTGAVLANIYLGKIKTWNDPGIAVSNPGRELPNLDITVVHRSDGSGTTAIWTSYLSKVSSAWKSQIGEGVVVNWPAGIAAEKNDGVADAVSRTAGAIGYVELSYALANDLSVGQVKNKSGVFIGPSVDGISAAAASMAEFPADLRFSLVDAPGTEAYPIVGTCWAIMRINQPSERGEDIVHFLRWITAEGQNELAHLQYGRLPKELAEKGSALLEKVVTSR
ncbi:phosphate ABC transporter substrate-binding protein PstS [Schlesneria paludicola]|uniref:phosphate ABC transporter substrate-binding protein PstS n=1 Tax=Schlesneria paludicola TaxID=360056 RepID=UPI00029AE477|nr:phosphate ABC transporter substrate-binding protein PstS [Schlesneria paludicola]